MTDNQHNGRMLLGVGVTACMIGIAYPVYEAHRGAGFIMISVLMTAFAPFGVVMGLLHTIGGKWAKTHLGDVYRPTSLGRSIGLTLFGLGICLCWVVWKYLQSRGF